jgi:hypothetical protein
MSPGVDCSPGLSSQIPNPHSETGNPPEGWESEGQTPNPKHQSSGCQVSGFGCQEKQTENLKPVGAKRQRGTLNTETSSISHPQSTIFNLRSKIFTASYLANSYLAFSPAFPGEKKRPGIIGIGNTLILY